MENDQTQPKVPHYYGDIVRGIFVLGAIYMLWGLPMMTDLFEIPVMVSIIAVVVLGVSAGITNPKQKYSLQLNAIVSVLFLMVFMYLSWFSLDQGYGTDVQIANQIAAVLFLASSYFSIKSLRGRSIGEIKNL